jgi:hypothetical protein
MNSKLDSIFGCYLLGLKCETRKLQENYIVYILD